MKILRLTSTNAGTKIEKEHVTVAVVNSRICHCILKRDHIPLLKGEAQALERKFGFP